MSHSDTVLWGDLHPCWEHKSSKEISLYPHPCEAVAADKPGTATVFFYATGTEIQAQCISDTGTCLNCYVWPYTLCIYRQLSLVPTEKSSAQVSQLCGIVFLNGQDSNQPWLMTLGMVDPLHGASSSIGDDGGQVCTYTRRWAQVWFGSSNDINNRGSVASM